MDNHIVWLQLWSELRTYQTLDKHGNADALSCLPLNIDDSWNDETQDTICLLEQQQLNDLPIKVVDIQQETVKWPCIV